MNPFKMSNIFRPIFSKPNPRGIETDEHAALRKARKKKRHARQKAQRRNRR